MRNLRRGGKPDANQEGIVRGLRAAGATVTITSAIGHGFPDLAVGYRGNNYLLEVKDPGKSAAKRRLTADEQDWHDRWRGAVHIVETVEGALAASGAASAHPFGSSDANAWRRRRSTAGCHVVGSM